MQTYLVRLKPYDPRRGHVLRRYAHCGIRFLVEHGWYRVDADVADHLRTAKQIDGDPHALAAFDVCSDEDARQIDTTEQARERATRATDDIPLTASRNSVPPRTTVATDGERAAVAPEPPALTDATLGRRSRKERE